MNDIEFDQLRDEISVRMSSLGRASKLDDGYFRLQKILGPEKSQRTTVAVYFRNIGANLIELAFEPGAVAESIGKPRAQVVEWISKMSEATDRETHPNPRFNYIRVGIGARSQLDEVLKKWSEFSEKDAAKRIATARSDEFVHVPFYLEADGEKTLFLPNLRRREGYQIGEKGNERYIGDYWEALGALQEMSVPRFRRPNKNNIFGIVACKPDDYDEVKRSYIEAQLANITL